MKREIKEKNKMTNKEIKTIFNEIYPGADIKVDSTGKKIHIKVSQMYEYVEVSLSILKEISKKMKCEEIDLESYQSDGCETCDYGSSYELTFICWNFE